MSSASSTFSPARDRALAVFFLCAWTAITILRQWGHWPEDLSAVYVAGWLWQSGQTDLIYAAPAYFFGGPAESWTPVTEALGIGDRVVFPFVYPPLWAVLTAPLTTVLGPQDFANAVMLVQMPMLAASVALAGRIFRTEAMPRWLWALIGAFTLSLTIPAYLAIWHNQPTITVTFLTLFAFERLNAGRPVPAGALLALAAAIKLTPAAFVLLFLVGRQYRAVAAFAIAGAALGLFSIVLAGWPLHQTFLESLAKVSSVSFLSALNISVKPALLALGSGIGLLPMPDPDLPQALYSPAIPAWLGPAISAIGLALAALLFHAVRRAERQDEVGLGLLALSVIVALFGPLGWLHYYLMPMLLLPGVLGILPRRRAALVLSAIALPSFTFVFGNMGVLPWPVANYVWWMSLAWLALLACLFASLRREGP